MRKCIFTILVVLCSLAVQGKVLQVHFSHADQTYKVDNASWDHLAADGDTIDLTVDDTPLGLYEIHTQRINKADNSLGADIAKKLGLPDLNPSGVPNPLGGTPPPLDLFNFAKEAADNFNDLLAQPSLYRTQYADARLASRATTENLLKAASVSIGADADTIADAVSKLLGTSVPAATVKSAVRLMKALYGAGPLGSVRLGSFDADQEFDLTISWKAPPDSPLRTPPDERMVVRFGTNFVFSTTGGFAFSRLVDHNYTTQTVEVTPATTDKPAVTKKIAVQEKDDAASPDATLFVHVGGVGETFRKWPVFVPRQLSFGVGIGSNASGRSYLGISWALARAASLTVGAAGGKVKMLSRNVEVQNLGTTDPQASRRDVFRITPFIGISWRIAASSPAAK